ncbi:MAG: hypothetical protein NTY80_03445 [candidate division SR1 bacterium]|nr:hypothetical protein [candidate division SR1 bacterium]
MQKLFIIVVVLISSITTNAQKTTKSDSLGRIEKHRLTQAEKLLSHWQNRLKSNSDTSLSREDELITLKSFLSVVKATIPCYQNSVFTEITGDKDIDDAAASIYGLEMMDAIKKLSKMQILITYRIDDLQNTKETSSREHQMDTLGCFLAIIKVRLNCI